MITAHRPICCLICGYYLATQEKYTGNRCVDPGHWQAAGLFAPGDFYLMAQMIAGVRAELARRPDESRDTVPSDPYKNHLFIDEIHVT